MKPVLKCALIVLMAALPMNASANDREPLELLEELDSTGRPTDRTIELLAQLMISEGGWDSPADHSAVAWSIASRFLALRRAGRATTLDDAILLYADVLDAPTSGRPLWISQIRTGCARPESMPERLRWELERRSRSGQTYPSRAERCAEIFLRAETFLFGFLEPPCERLPDHWGGPMDDHRAAVAVAAGTWRELTECGTANRFFEVVPRSERRIVRGPIRIGGRVVKILPTAR